MTGIPLYIFLTILILQNNKSRKAHKCFPGSIHGDGGIRTHDLYTASVALSQLSYAPNRVSIETLTIIQEIQTSFNIFFWQITESFFGKSQNPCSLFFFVNHGITGDLLCEIGVPHHKVFALTKR